MERNKLIIGYFQTLEKLCIYALVTASLFVFKSADILNEI